jgi:HEAT repeat protein
MSHKKHLPSHHTHTSPPTTPTEPIRAPSSAVNAIMGRLGLAREANEPEANEPALSRALTDPSWAIRVEATQKLGKLGRLAPLELLLVALCDEQSNVRVAAARALSRNPRQAAVPALVSALEDREWVVRVEAARALGSLPESAPLEPLLLAAKDKDPTVRAAAIWALGRTGAERAFEPLNTALQDEDWSVRETAALALGQLAEQAAVPPLLNARMDRDASVRTAAGASLQQLYPEFSSSPPPRSDSFEQWLERTDYSKRQDPPYAGEEQHQALHQKSAILYKKKTQSTQALTGLSNRRKSPPTPAYWPHRLGELAGSLLAAFILICLLVSWLAIATWPRSSYLGHHGISAFTTYRGHNSSVNQLAWSPDGLTIASADTRGTVLVWQASTGQRLTSHIQRGKVLALSWSSTTAVRVVYAEPNRVLQINILNIGTGLREEMLFQQTNLPDIPEAAAWSPNGQFLAFDMGNGFIQIWDPAAQMLLTTIKNKPTQYTRILWSPDGNQLATISAEGLLQVWGAWTGRSAGNLEASQEVSIAAWLPCSNHFCMLFINTSGAILNWAPTKGSNGFSELISQQTYNLEDTSDLIVEALTISPSSDQFIMGTSDGIVQARDSTTMNLVDIYRGHSASVNAAEWSPDGNSIATGSSDTTVQVWQEPGA